MRVTYSTQADYVIIILTPPSAQPRPNIDLGTKPLTPQLSCFPFPKSRKLQPSSNLSSPFDMEKASKTDALVSP
ncbi:Uncharacterized protein HZ326_21536 [Fusarium oxysporum f. sp. albedinis]|nr:Uncharacterized protein HZ326_21536 [Fusarium oxysporum f. sp. albedinis]